MQLKGLGDILEFLDFLKKNHHWYRLDHVRYNAVMVTIHTAGMRIEVEFFVDHIEYGIFSGDESVFEDQNQLIKLLTSTD